VIRTCEQCQTRNRVPESRITEAPKCGRCGESLGRVEAPIELKAARDFDALVKDSPVPVLVDFWAAWCGPCRMVAPELEVVAKRRAGELVVAKVSTTELPDVAARFGVRAIPTMLLFHRGKQTRRISGAMPAAEIERQLGF